MVPNGTEYADYPIFAGSGTKVKPSPDSKYAQGFLPGETFPAEWSNYLFYGATGGITRLNADTNSIKKELNSILTAYGIANNADAFNQLLTALNRIYPQICECTTAAGTEVKSVAITGDGVILKAGNVYAITMTHGNTYGDGSSTYPKLSINSSTARPLCDANGNYLKAGAWAAGNVITVLYTGTKFLMATRAVTDAITENDMSPVTSDAVYKELEKQFDILHPIGECYTQYPGQKDPNQLWGNLSTWVELDYAGAFFRSNGGNAEDFEKSLAISNVNGTTITFSAAHGLDVGSVLYDPVNNEGRTVTSVTDTTTVVINNGFTNPNLTNVLIGQYDQFQGHEHRNMRAGSGSMSNHYAFTNNDSNYSPTLGIVSDGTNGTPRVGNETRPVNLTVKVWKRTA